MQLAGSWLWSSLCCVVLALVCGGRAFILCMRWNNTAFHFPPNTFNAVEILPWPRMAYCINSLPIFTLCHTICTTTYNYLRHWQHCSLHVVYLDDGSSRSPGRHLQHRRLVRRSVYVFSWGLRFVREYVDHWPHCPALSVLRRGGCGGLLVPAGGWGGCGAAQWHCGLFLLLSDSISGRTVYGVPRYLRWVTLVSYTCAYFLFILWLFDYFSYYYAVWNFIPGIVLIRTHNRADPPGRNQRLDARHRLLSLGRRSLRYGQRGAEWLRIKNSHVEWKYKLIDENTKYLFFTLLVIYFLHKKVRYKTFLNTGETMESIGLVRFHIYLYFSKLTSSSNYGLKWLANIFITARFDKIIYQPPPGAAPQ